MEPFPILPPTVAADVARYVALAAKEGLVLSGLFLVGSVALGDFREGISDIDFIAVLESPADARMIGAIGRVHSALESRSDRPHFDGAYVTADQLRDPPPPMSRAPFVVEGVFRPDAPCGELTPAVWTCLAQSGIRVIGPTAKEIGIQVDRDATTRFLRHNLATYWASWTEAAETAIAAKGADDVIDANVMGSCVHGTARIAVTIETGRVVSKTAAAIWALETASVHRGAVRRALSARRGQLSKVTLEEARGSVSYAKSVIARHASSLTP